MEYNVLNQEMQHHKSTEQSISKPVHHEQTASDQPSIDNLFQGEEYEVGVKSQLNNSEGENVSPFFEVGLGHNQTIVENNKPDFNDDVPDIKSEPDLNDNVQDLPKFDKIIEYNGNAKVHQNMLDNVFGTFDPTYTFCDLSDVLDVVDQDQTSATCCVGVSRDACVDNMLPAFDKIKGDSEITCSHLKDNTALDNNPPSVINDPVSLDESIEESGEEDSLINGYITCIEDNNVLGSDALDTYSVNNYCGFELVMDDLKSEGTVHKDEIEYVDSELEKETMAESPLPDCKLLQDHDSGETKINVANCNNLSVIPSNVLENESLTIERNRANNNVIHEEKQSKTSNFGWGVTNTVILCDDTDIEKVVDNNSEHTVEMEDETDELCVESRSELCSLRTGNLHVGKDSADGICSTESGAELCSQRAKQDTCMSDTDIVTDDTTEYLTEKESCFVVLGTLLVIMCIELYSSSNKHIGAVTAVETDLLESTDDLGLNLLFKDEAGELSSRNPRRNTSTRSKAARKRKKQQQKLLPLVTNKKKTKIKFAENLEDLRPSWYNYETSLTDVDHSLTCSICLEMFYKPSVCQPCAHIFCDPCLRRLTRGLGSEGILCPLCRTVIGSCSLDKEFNEQLMMSHPEIFYACHSTEKKSKYRHFLLPFTPPVPLSKRLLRHLVTNRTNLPPMNQGTLYNCSKLLVGCLAGACISVLIMLFCHVRGIHSARDVNVMFLSFFAGAVVTIVVNKVMRF